MVARAADAVGANEVERREVETAPGDEEEEAVVH